MRTKIIAVNSPTNLISSSGGKIGGEEGFVDVVDFDKVVDVLQ